MREAYEISTAWRGARWDRRSGRDRRRPGAARRWQAPALALLLGVALGVTITRELARQDRVRFEALMAGVQAGG